MVPRGVVAEQAIQADQIIIMKLIRSQQGFQRFALAIQYHGGRYIGYSAQKDERIGPGGLRSVEGCLRDALNGEK